MPSSALPLLTTLGVDACERLAGDPAQAGGGGLPGTAPPALTAGSLGVNASCMELGADSPMLCDTPAGGPTGAETLPPFVVGTVGPVKACGPGVGGDGPGEGGNGAEGGGSGPGWGFEGTLLHLGEGARGAGGRGGGPGTVGQVAAPLLK